MISYHLPPNKSRLTIVGPHFFSYLDAIVNHIEKLGIPAQAIDERGSQSFLTKAIFRSSLLRRLLPMVVRVQHEVVVRKAIDFKSTHVIFISPESVNAGLVESLKESGMAVSLYMWDSFDNKPAALCCLSSFDKLATFDPVDAKAHKLMMINLFAEEEFFSKKINAQLPEIDISFVGTAHSSRPIIIKKFVTNPNFFSLNKKIHLYRGNAYYYLRALMITSFSQNTPISKDSLSKKTVANIFLNSKYVLDITHKNQRGLTSRTFEALAAGSVLVTNNKWAKDILPNFIEKIIFFDDIDSLTLDRKEKTPVKINLTDISYLTIDRFCKDIIELVEL